MAKAKDSKSGKSSASGRSEEKPIDAVTAREAFQRLDELLKKTLTLYMGGGTAPAIAAPETSTRTPVMLLDTVWPASGMHASARTARRHTKR